MNKLKNMSNIPTTRAPIALSLTANTTKQQWGRQEEEPIDAHQLTDQQMRCTDGATNLTGSSIAGASSPVERGGAIQSARIHVRTYEIGEGKRYIT